MIRNEANLVLKLSCVAMTDYLKKKSFFFNALSLRSEGVSEKTEYVGISTDRDLSILLCFVGLNNIQNHFWGCPSWGFWNSGSPKWPKHKNQPKSMVWTVNSLRDVSETIHNTHPNHSVSVSKRFDMITRCCFCGILLYFWLKSENGKTDCQGYAGEL